MEYERFDAPVTVVIKNEITFDEYDEGALVSRGTAVPAEDPGSKQRHKDYISTDRKIQFYRVNSFVTLAAGESIKVVAETSEEAAYFASLANEDISVNFQ